MDTELQLPIFSYHDTIVQQVLKSDTTIIISSTGSGKTTQIPQYLFKNNLHKGKMIGVTQPRRIAAISIALRVAEEMHTNVGGLVGYSVRFENVCSDKTRIKFMTDGILLREAAADPLLRIYSIVMLDEAHERSLNTEILLGVVRNAQMIRLKESIPPLKVVIMSATIDPLPFVNHFSRRGVNTSMIDVNSQPKPLSIKSLSKPTEDYVRTAVALCVQMHCGKVSTSLLSDFVNDLNKSILIFLTGEEDIHRCCSLLMRESSNLIGSNRGGFRVRPLYSALSAEAQKDAVTGPHGRNGARNIIVATNIAETSITIPGVRVVIDCGYGKQKFVNSVSGLESLKICRISQAQAEQRAGRASRLGPGLCIRLYTDYEYNNHMPEQTQSELHRSSLVSICLSIFSLGFTDIRSFPWFEQPPADQIQRSLNILTDLRAICVTGNTKLTFELTDVGRILLRFPVDPRLAYAITEAAAPERNCVADVTAVVAMLSVADHLFYSRSDSASDDLSSNPDIRQHFFSNYGDLVLLLRIYRAYKQLGSSVKVSDWCRSYGFKQAELHRAVQINKQLKAICVKADLPLRSCNEEHANIVRCFVRPFMANLCTISEGKPSSKKMNRQSVYSATYRNAAMKDTTLSVHPASVLCLRSTPPDIILFMECLETNKVFAKYVSYVMPDWLN